MKVRTTIEIDKLVNITPVSDNSILPVLSEQPFISASYNSDENGDSWTVEFFCYLPFQDIREEDIKIIPEEEVDMFRDLLPAKKLCVHIEADNLEEKSSLWYIKTKPFVLERFYNVIEVFFENTTDGPRRGGQTIGLSTK